MRKRSWARGLVGWIMGDAAPAAPVEVPASAIPLAKVKSTVMAAIAGEQYPSAWRTHSDGRRYRVTAMQWIDGRGVVPTLEWEDGGGAS